MRMERVQWKEICSFEKRSSGLLQEAIGAAIEAIEAEAKEKFVGRMIEFEYRWHPIEDMVSLSASILDVIVEVNDYDYNVNLRWKVEVRNPRSGHNVTLDLNPEFCRFLWKEDA